MWCICSHDYVKERFMSSLGIIQTCKWIPTKTGVDQRAHETCPPFQFTCSFQHLQVLQLRTRHISVFYSSSPPTSFTFCSSSLNHSLPMHSAHFLPEIHACCLHPEYRSRWWQYGISSRPTSTFRHGLWRLLVWAHLVCEALSGCHLFGRRVQLALFSL